MPMTQISLSGLETETDSVTSKTSTLQDMVNPSFMSNSQKDILQIIRKEEDHAMSLLAASPLLSSLFLAYANKAATFDGPAAPSPVDLEWTEMKALNNRLQEEVASLRAQLDKETDRAKTAEDCVGALRAQLYSVKEVNYDLETTVSKERARLDAMTSEYTKHKEETADTIAELRDTVDKEAGARAALSQVIADQQITLVQLKEKNECPSPPFTSPEKSPHTQGRRNNIFWGKEDCKKDDAYPKEENERFLDSEEPTTPGTPAKKRPILRGNK